jgi:acetyl esterase
LRDESEAYVIRLREAGVSMAYTCYDGAIHAFFTMAGILDQGKQGIGMANAWLKEILPDWEIDVRRYC